MNIQFSSALNPHPGPRGVGRSRRVDVWVRLRGGLAVRGRRVRRLRERRVPGVRRAGPFRTGPRQK